jgi:hypothetical protein
LFQFRLLKFKIVKNYNIINFLIKFNFDIFDCINCTLCRAYVVLLQQNISSQLELAYGQDDIPVRDQDNTESFKFIVKKIS